LIWIVYAILASVFWGISYAVNDQLLRRVSVASVILYGAAASAVFALGLGFATNAFTKDWQLLKQAGTETKLMAASVAVYVIANLFILLSIHARNGTMAAMVEITYPLFTALFAWLIFKEAQVTVGTMAGALLILAGVACVYFFGKEI
jgi:drug/metabolite transporter (DMT)-like permease